MEPDTFLNALADEFFPRRILFSALFFGAVAGVMARSLVWPERGIKQLLQQGAAGILVAVFGGGYFASLLPTADDEDVLAYLLVGLTFAILGEVAVKLLQHRGRRMLGEKDEKR